SDGLNSRVRDALGLLAFRMPLGYGAVRMLVPRSAEDLRDPGDRPKYIEYLSGTRRILYTPSSATDLYVALCCEETDVAARTVPIDVRLWCESFPHLSRLVRRLGDAGRWDTFELLKL